MEQTKKRKKLSKMQLTLLGLLLSLALLNGCVSAPPDVPVFVELSPNLGWGTYTISNKEFFVDNDKQLYEGKTWSQLLATCLHLPPSSFSAIKIYILENCKQNNNCSQQISPITEKMDDISKKMSN